MGNEYHPEGLRESGKGLSDVAQRSREEWQRLDSHVKGLGDIFGQDDVGSLIGMAYQVIHDKAAEVHSRAADDFEKLGAGLKGVGDIWEEVESQYAQLLGQIKQAAESSGGAN